MKNESYLRYVLSDNASLFRYYKKHEAVSLADVRRSVLLNVRSQRYAVPDHYYRLGMEKAFLDISVLSEVFTKGLPRLAEDYLELHGTKVYVKADRFNDWQLLLPLMPPLLLVTALIWKVKGPVGTSLADFAHEYLRPSVMYTAIPQAFIPEMEVLKTENQGLSDLHIHLNGAVETDAAWHDFLRFPDAVCSAIKEACRNDKVKEQLEQLTDLCRPNDFYKLFCIAGRLREWLCGRVVYEKDVFEATSFEQLLIKLRDMDACYTEHPMQRLMGECVAPMILESMLYSKVLDYLSEHRDDGAVTGAFHYYLLILGLSNKLLVQQTDTFGFEQFQKYTSNNFREFSERTYSRRFLQLAGNDLDNILHIEGRFSPKKSCVENSTFIARIADGFHHLTTMQEAAGVYQSELSLVAHFIKERDNGTGECRFHNLRRKLAGRTEALVQFLNERSSLSMLVKGIDAAASEFDTPPEVFAPSFRRLRSCGVRHFTYHAGEDFYHVLSGLRAIYEAIVYLDLRPGDRIGHATATGIDVNVWKDNVGRQIWMRREDWLSDLVFVYHLVSTTDDKALAHLLPTIALAIEEHTSRIYSNTYSVYEMVESWLYRAEDPLVSATAFPSRVRGIYDFYHSKEGRDRGREIIPVDTLGIFGVEELNYLQKLLLHVMHQKQIVIETLPTSNVIIGHHHSFATYHLYNWYKWSRAGVEVPAIVVGTDDAGIFATNIYNEYCHIYCLLVFEKGMAPYEAISYIQHLEHNAKVYAFR